MVYRLIYLNGHDEFIRVLYNLELVLVALDSSNSVILVNKTHVRDLVPMSRVPVRR
jgi:hypothetical protein